MKLLTTVLITIALAGCANYQFGDASESVYELRQQYCEETNPVTKYLLLGSLEKRIESYPEGGLCVDLTERLLNEYTVSK